MCSSSSAPRASAGRRAPGSALLLLLLAVLGCGTAPRREDAPPPPAPRDASRRVAGREAAPVVPEGERVPAPRAGEPVEIELSDLCGPPDGSPLLRVAGEAITASRVLRILQGTRRDLVDRATDYLVEAAGVIAECRRLGIGVTGEELEPYLAGDPKGRTMAKALGSLEMPDLPVEIPSLPRGRLARAAVRALTERLIRYLAMREERATVGLVRLEDEKRAEDVRRKLLEGADLRRIARAESRDPSAERGGVLPPIPRSRPTPLAREAFRLAEGEVSPVLAAKDGERTVFFVLKMLRRDPPTSAPYSEVAREIAASLRLHPVTAEERFYLSLRLAERRPPE